MKGFKFHGIDAGIKQDTKADLGIIVENSGARALYIDETGCLLTYEELMMYFMKYDKYIARSKGSPIFISVSSSNILEQYAVDTLGYNILKTKKGTYERN